VDLVHLDVRLRQCELVLKQAASLLANWTSIMNQVREQGV
jgi:hypothetical protein